MSGEQPPALTQIAAAASYHPSLPDVLYGLAADGTVWRLVVKLNEVWQPLPLLPAPDAPAAGRTSVFP
jgi:hypothetical protein